MKSVVISGASTGIGFASACALDAAGWRVFAGVRTPEDEARLRALFSPRSRPVRLDVTENAQIAALKALVEGETGGRLDALVNNAGIGSMRDIEQCTTEEWRRTFAVNADGVFFGCREGVRAMKSHGGSIVNISSVSGLIGGRNLVAYNASKGAVRLLTKSVALHCAHRKYGIRCNSVHPTFIETPMVEAMLQATRDPTQTLATLKASIPLGRLGQADEIADLLVYLVSDESQFCTGAEFVIDGGMTAS
jgi:3(or 17)beta-hydroxysteroid dehydrogenase